MFSGMLEVKPRADQVDLYFKMAMMLKPEVEKIDGFVDNARFSSLTRPGWLLSLSNWRNEKSLVRWTVEEHHHKVMQAARDRVFADYRMHIGEVTQDTRLPEGYTLVQQRLDVTEVAPGKAITLLDAHRELGWVKEVSANAVAESLGFDPGVNEVTEWDVFESVATPGDVIAVVKWADLNNAEAFEQSLALPDGVRLRQIRVVRDYGMFDRRESPQYFAEVSPNKDTEQTSSLGKQSVAN